MNNDQKDVFQTDIFFYYPYGWYNLTIEMKVNYMKICITGLNGTVAPATANHLASLGHVIIPFNRDYVDIKSEKAVLAILKEVSPDWVIHFAMGSIEWTKMLAALTKNEAIKFMYISTVMVFDGQTQQGPHHIEDKPQPKETYGLHKYESEQAVIKLNPDASIVRLGWQIGHVPGSNQMIDYLEKEMKAHGVVKASKKAFPASSFLTDSALAIAQILTMKPDLYMVDSNDGVSLYDIFTYLSHIHPWIKVIEEADVAWNNQMIDPRIKIRKFSKFMK